LDSTAAGLGAEDGVRVGIGEGVITQGTGWENPNFLSVEILRWISFSGNVSARKCRGPTTAVLGVRVRVDVDVDVGGGPSASAPGGRRSAPGRRGCYGSG
jgi:hypothetical protein